MKNLIYAFLCVPSLALATVSNFTFEKYDELLCLSKNIFFEADNQGDLGQRAVAWVTLNRVKSRKWLPTVCGVVYQPSFDPNRPYACQFSWTCAKVKRKIERKENLLFDKIHVLAYSIYSGQDNRDITYGATYYVKCNIIGTRATNFLQDAIFTVRINDHCFFKDKIKALI